MSLRVSSLLRPGLVLAAGAVLAGCGTVDGATRRFANAITPYRVEVVQGNFVSSEQVELLKPGMSRQQVREILGTSLLSDVFHNNRWDYVFTIRRQGVDPQERRLTVFFNGELMDRFEGDEMPSEEDFVATLDTRKKAGKVPPLEASEDDLKKFAPSKDEKKGDTAGAQASLPPLPAAYPPLEAAR